MKKALSQSEEFIPAWHDAELAKTSDRVARGLERPIPWSLAKEILNNREPQDYTRWRTERLHLGDSVHEVARRAHAISAQYEEMRQALSH